MAVLLLAACDGTLGSGGARAVSDQPVTLAADDSTELVGSYDHPGGTAPGLLLLHGLGADRSEWDVVALPGYATLAMDLRGHGESGGDVPDDDGQVFVDDARISLAWLASQPGVDAGRVAIVGSSIGANVALAAAANDPDVGAAVLVSPSLDSLQISTEDDLHRYEPRPSLMYATEEDTEAADAVATLVAQGGHVDATILQGEEHGVALLLANPKAADELVAWLEEHLVASQEPESDGGMPDAE